jgi:membrane protein DedA with SNARE-associated domain
MEPPSLSDALINLIPIYGPWIIFGIVRNAVVFFRRFIAVPRMLAALLAGANCMPAGRFSSFNMTGGVCWACLFVFGA